MRDLHRTTALRQAPYTQYEVGILQPTDAEEYAPLLLELYKPRSRGWSARVAEEEEHLMKLMQRGTKIAVAMPVGELAIAADARVTRYDEVSITSVVEPQAMPRALLDYMQAYVDPNHNLPPSHDYNYWDQALVRLMDIDSRLPIDPVT